MSEKFTVPCQLQLLGKFNLASRCPPSSTAHSSAYPQRKKARLLLTYLALHPVCHSRRHLCEVLWNDPDRRAALSVELNAIRSCFDLPPGQQILLVSGDTIQLNTRWLEADVACFEKLLHQATQAQDIRHALRFRLHAIQLYARRGPILRDEYADAWLVTYREKLEMRFQRACAQAIDNLKTVGRERWATQALTTLRTRYPRNESFAALAYAKQEPAAPSSLPLVVLDTPLTPDHIRRYHALSPLVRSIFLSLCLCDGPVSLAAAVALHPVRHKDKRAEQEERICHALTLLHQEGFLVRQEGVCGPFFCALPAWRAYIGANLPLRARDDMLRRQAAYYCALMQKGHTVAETPKYAAWQEQIEAEYANIRQTLGFYSRHPNAHFHAELIVSLAPFWQDKGRYQEAARWYRQAHRRRHELPANVYHELRRARGSLALLRGRTALALCCYRKAQQGCTSASDRQQLAQSFNDLGIVAHHRQEDALARSAYEASLALCATLNLPVQEAGARAGLGDTLLLAEGDVEGARQQYECAYALREAAFRLTHRADIRYRLSEIYRIRGEYAQAVSLLDEALHLFGQHQERHGEAQCQARLGTLLVEQGRLGMGSMLLKTSRDFYAQAGDACAQSATEARIAEMHMRQGHFDPAQALLERGKQTWQAIDHTRWIALFNARLARVACGQERFADALTLSEQSLAGYERSPSPFGVAYAQCCRAHAMQGLRRRAEALVALSAALEIWNRAGYLKGIVEGLETAAHLALEEHDWQTGAKALGKASVLRAQIGLPLPPAEEEKYAWMRNGISARKKWEVAWSAGEHMELTALLKVCCLPYAVFAKRSE